MKVAVVGATGLVGQEMLRILAERKFPVTELLPIASEKSVGQKIEWQGKTYSVIGMQAGIDARPALAIFSAGGSTSLEFAPAFAAVGTTVIDNSSAWRMQPDKKLIVPEINAHLLTAEDKIIANPNCSTIQMVVALNLLHKQYKIRRIIVSTYQSVTGTGKKAVDQLFSEREKRAGEKAYPYPIDLNVLPHIDVFMENGYTKEEMKMINETRKILNEPTMHITATTVRVPVVGGHSESVNVEFKKEFYMHEVLRLLNATPGVKVVDDVKNNLYPMPIHSHGKDEVFVGRVRRDESQPKTLNLWVVADNLRKGAATNAIQIAEHLLQNKLLQNN